MKTANSIIAVVIGAILLSPGCSKKQAPTTMVSWNSAKYRMTVAYPSNWKVKDLDYPEDPKRGVMAVVLFRKLTENDKPELTERPPLIKILWTPKTSADPAAQSTPEPQITSGGAPDIQDYGRLGVPVEHSGMTTGWTEFGAEGIKTRKLIWPGDIPAEEATALAVQGSPFFSEQTGGQLIGEKQSVRKVLLSLQGGFYEITRVAPMKEADTLKEADQIVDSLRLGY